MDEDVRKQFSGLLQVLKLTRMWCLAQPICTNNRCELIENALKFGDSTIKMHALSITPDAFASLNSYVVESYVDQFLGTLDQR